MRTAAAHGCSVIIANDPGEVEGEISFDGRGVMSFLDSLLLTLTSLPDADRLAIAVLHYGATHSPLAYTHTHTHHHHYHHYHHCHHSADVAAMSGHCRAVADLERQRTWQPAGVVGLAHACAAPRHRSPWSVRAFSA